MSRTQPRSPLTPDRQALAADHLPLARAAARRVWRRWLTLRAEAEAACLALVEAAADFDPGFGVEFRAYARIRLRGAMVDVQRRNRPLGWKAAEGGASGPGTEALGYDAEDLGRVLLCEPDPPVGWAVESEDAVEWWLRKLPPRYAAACRRVWLYGQTFRQAGAAIGCSESRAAWMHAESLMILNHEWAARVRAAT